MKKLFGLIGNPLEHSFSEKIFNEKFKNNKLDWAFKMFPIKSLDELEPLIKNNHLEGFTVTYPYKQSIIPYLNEKCEIIEFVHAVNTVCVNYDENDKFTLKGFNTDIVGFEYLLNKALSNNKSTKHKALILGTGGASKAVQFVLRKKGIVFVLVSRKIPKAGQIQYDNFSQNTLKNFDLIINTTPLGMYPDVESCPKIDINFLSTNHCLIDLIYNPEETMFLKMGKEAGCKTMNGLQMLEKDIDASFEIWKQAKIATPHRFLGFSI